MGGLARDRGVRALIDYYAEKVGSTVLNVDAGSCKNQYALS
jgi:hypothetical protein